MRLVHASAVAIAVAVAVSAVSGAPGQDADRKVAGGGITAKGWQGKIDARAAKQGRTINDSKFVQEGNNLHLTIGPAASYWNPANVAKGDYTVKATFKEGKTNSDHAHPYGIFIGGTNLDSENAALMYCVAYGDGTVLVRRLNGAQATDVAKRAPNPAVNKAGADGSVTQEIAWSVKGDKAECLVNGKSIGSFAKADIVGPGKLDSTDGIYGLRVSHNVDVVVSNFGASK